MENFDKFCYIFVIVMVLLDRGTTIYYFKVLNMPVELERNLIARFILENDLWMYYFSTTLGQISLFIVLVSLFKILASSIDHNYPMIFPLLLSSLAFVNNALVLIFT